jgi:hypothetical protein
MGDPVWLAGRAPPINVYRLKGGWELTGRGEMKNEKFKIKNEKGRRNVNKLLAEHRSFMATLRVTRPPSGWGVG